MADVRHGGSQVQGTRAHDDAELGTLAAGDAPIKIGGKAVSAVPSLVSAGDRVDAFFDLAGRQVTARKAATATVTSVNDTNSSTTLLAANAARLGFSIYNDSSAALYVKYGDTASMTSYTVRLVQHAYYEDPYGYTGRVDGIWASDPNDGGARITELT